MQGTGKTRLAKAMVSELNKALEEESETSAESSTVAEETPLSPSPTSQTENVAKTDKKKYSFFYRKATDCFNKYVGESERTLRELFALAKKEAPSVIFFDEFDGLCPTRTKDISEFRVSVVTTLLGLMDSVKSGEILVIAATNRLESIDPAIRRAGRFDRVVGFSMPGKEDRQNILQIHTKAWKNGNGKEILEEMAEKTVGYSGADLQQLVRLENMIFCYSYMQRFTLFFQYLQMFSIKPYFFRQTLLFGMQRHFDAKTPVLEIRTEDWHTALSQPKPSSGKQAFGCTFLQRVPPGVKELLQTNMKKIEEKLQPILSDIKETSKTNCSGGLNSFIISSCRGYDEDVDGYLVPLLLTESKLFKDVAPYTLDLSDVQKLTKERIQSTLDQLCSPPDGKIALLLVPQIDVFIKMKFSVANAGGIVDYVLTRLQTLRGKNIILLATSKLDLKNMQQMEEMVALFKGIICRR